MLVLVTLEQDHGRIVDEMIASLQGTRGDGSLVCDGEQDRAASGRQGHAKLRAVHLSGAPPGDQVRSFKHLVVMKQHKRCGALLPGKR